MSVFIKSSRVTIDDIARHANVSKATVSRVLNNPKLVNQSKQDAVMAAVSELGFQPNLLARGLASGQSMTIGIVTQNIGTSFYDDIIRAITKRLRTTAYSPIFGDGLYEEKAQAATLNTLCDRQVDGIILLGGNASEEELRDAARRRPLVVVARDLPHWEGTSFYCDNFDLGYQATRYLIDHGHTAIAHVTGNLSHQDGVRRTEGYKAALREADLKVDPSLIYEGNFYGQSGVLAVESWLQRGINFSAVFAANDLTAFGVNLALSRRRIRVPDEVSLIGIDNKIESALVSPPLTTIRQPADELGTAAAEAIIELISGKPANSKTLIGEVIRRESVGTRH